MVDNYVFLKTLDGDVVYPRTDLGAIDLTTINGLVVSGNTMGIMGGYIESSYYMNMVSGTDAANQTSAYIEGGTMFQLIGGYTVTDEIPPIANAAHDKVPSEYSVRSAIDALATVGPSFVPGAGIVMEMVSGGTGGTIAVAPGDGINVNTAQTGGVSVKAGTGISVDSNGVNVNTATNNTFGGIAGATNGVTLVNGVAQVDAGDGLLIGSGKVAIDEASVGTTLQDVRIDGTSTVTPVNDQVVTPGNLRGALSVGQAVDVSCAPTASNGTVTYADDDFLNTITWTISGSDFPAQDFFGFGGLWSSEHTWINHFPKYAPGLKYLFICDIECDTACSLGHANSGYVRDATAYTGSLPANTKRRVAIVFNNTTAAVKVVGRSTSSIYVATITNCRQYEVTALTDEAIDYIAQLDDPDAFFRSTSAYSIRDKYLIKQDMVCPFIPTINMPDNSDLTVAAGLSYKIKYTNDDPHTITADTIPADAYGWDTHIQMFIKGTSAINFQKPLILMDALTPNAGHNLSIKWRNGAALVYVDDTNAGYIVVTASGTGDGTLNFGIVDPGTDYVIFAAGLAGTTVDAGTAVFGSTATTLTTLSILGNGTDATILTGNIGATSGKTINFQSLTIAGGTLSGAGTMYLDDTVIEDTLEVGSGTTASFKDTNILDATVTGTGRLRNAEGSTLTSTVPEGSTAGLGVITGMYFASDNGFASGNVTLSNLTITGCTTYTSFRAFLINPAANKQVNIVNCIISGNIGSDGSGARLLQVLESGSCIKITGSTIVNTSRSYTLNASAAGSYVDITDSVLYGCFLYDTVITMSGNCTWITAVNLSTPGNGKLVFTPGSTTSLGAVYRNDGFTGLCYVGSYDFATNTTTEEGVATFIVYGRTFSLAGCTFTSISAAAGMSAITCGAMDVWSADNALFSGIVDAHKAFTVQLSGTTFYGSSKVLNANRIQLPADSTNSFAGNNNAANTKILDASLIVVGDNPASPSGSATVVNASGTSSTVSGIGTYIDKEGDNDFVANNTTNVVAVDNSTTGAKYLGTVLSATTGNTGANRFAKIDSGAVAVVNEATNAVNKQIITHDYEPILGGTFSLTSATVNEATKTTTILNDGTMSVVDIRGGKDSVINLGGINHIPQRKDCIISGATITGGGGFSYGGAMEIISGGYTATLNDVTFTGNSASYLGNAVAVGSDSVLSATNCIFSGNTGSRGAVGLVRSATVYLSGCTFDNEELVTVTPGGENAVVYLSGDNTIYRIRKETSSGAILVTISSGASINLTGYISSYITGGITVLTGGCTVNGNFISAGTYTSINSNGTTNS